MKEFVADALLKLVCSMELPTGTTPDNVPSGMLLEVLQQRMFLGLKDISYVKNILQEKIHLDYSIKDPELRIRALFLQMANVIEELTIVETSTNENELTLSWTTQEKWLLRALPVELSEKVRQSREFSNMQNKKKELYLHTINEAKSHNWTCNGPNKKSEYPDSAHNSTHPWASESSINEFGRRSSKSEISRSSHVKSKPKSRKSSASSSLASSIAAAEVKYRSLNVPTPSNVARSQRSSKNFTPGSNSAKLEAARQASTTKYVHRVASRISTLSKQKAKKI